MGEICPASMRRKWLPGVGAGAKARVGGLANPNPNPNPNEARHAVDPALRVDRLLCKVRVRVRVSQPSP